MRRKSSLILLFYTVFICLFARVWLAFADTRVALVIGNSEYKNTPPLANPANDATDVTQALAAIGFQVTLKINADKREMDQAVAQFARDAGAADAAMFYYAGHGMQFEGRNYVMPVDAELRDEISLRYEMTAIDDVKAALQRSSGVKIMVLDSCRNNPLATKLVRSISVTTRDIPNVMGFARPEKTRGMIIVYATQADDVANDGSGRNSPFSTAFLKEIKEPGLEVGTMFRRVGSDVYQATNGQQSPELSISLVPEYYLNQAETDQTIWARIRDGAEPDTLREFLDRYPKSFYAPDARARLELLDRENGSADAGAAQIARLRADELERERAAEKAKAHEQALESRLAAAEAERQKLAAELAARETARTADTGASSDKDRVGKENASRVSPSEADRAEALKAEIASLQQQAAEAKAEAERAADARKTPAPAEGKPVSLCSPRETEVQGRCVAKTCPADSYLARNGACVRRPPPEPRMAAVRAMPRPAAAPRPAAPAARGGHCFNFSGNQYCE